jgi:hypothetical protein
MSKGKTMTKTAPKAAGRQNTLDDLGGFGDEEFFDLAGDLGDDLDSDDFDDLDGGFDDDDDEGSDASPLDKVPNTGNPEVDGAAQLSETERSFKADAQRAQKQMDLATDSEYWVCLVFKTREEVESFLTNSGWAASDEKYVDGRKVADKLGVKYKREDFPFPKTRIDKGYARLAMGVKKL